MPPSEIRPLPPTFANLDSEEGVDQINTSEEAVVLEEILDNGDTQEPVPATPKRIFTSPRKPMKRKLPREDPRVDYAFSVLKELKNSPKDECSTYGDHVANKLRKFNDSVRAIVMHRINNIIFDAEMGHNTVVHEQQQKESASPHYTESSPSSSLSYVNSPHSLILSYVESPQGSPLQEFVQTFTDSNL
ncbi:hypothetical protein CBL_09890 [Carabus blaptoides fortunei]